MPKYTQVTYSTRKPYGLGKFLLDLLLVFITGGLWLIWMLFRFLRTA